MIASAVTALCTPTTAHATTGLFTHNTNASAGTTSNAAISASSPHFSFLNNDGITAAKQRTEVYTDIQDSNVVAYWKLDTATGALVDSSGRGHALTAVGAPGSTTGPTASFGQAGTFNGTSQSYRTPDHADFTFGTQVTGEAWVRTTDVTSNSWMTILDQEPSSSIESFLLDVDVGAGKLEFCVSVNGSEMNGCPGVSPSLISDGLWHYVVGTYDGTTARFYLDGTQRATKSAPGTIYDTPNQPFYIGDSFGTWNEYWHGDIDEVRISKVARTPAEILNYYNAKLPHVTKMWDSDPTDAGIAQANCSNGARCADVVYGSTGSAALPLQMNATRYWVRQKLATGAGAWSAWGPLDWFRTVTNVAPNAPALASLSQFRNDTTTVIGSGAWTADGTSNDVVLKFTASDGDAAQTLTPWVEIAQGVNAFTNTCGANTAATFSGTPVSAPTAGTAVAMSVPVTGLATHTSYRWRACVVDQSGTASGWTAKGASPDFKIDSANPTNATTRADGTAADIDWQTSLTQLDANFSGASDGAGSGVANSDWCFTTNNANSCGAGIVGAAGLAQAGTTAQRTGLTLTAGTLYSFCVRTRDAVGNVSAYSCSDGVRADTTSPTNATTRNDGTAADIDWQTSLTQLDANFSGASDGAGSGVANYDWCFTTNNANSCGAGIVGAAGLAQAGTIAQRTGLTLTAGTLYSFCIRTRDTAGNVSTYACSDGVTPDTSAPAAPATRNDGTAADIDWTTSLTQLDANFTAATDTGGSGVANYDWCFTTNNANSCGAGIVGAAGLAQPVTTAQRTGLTLTAGTPYYFCVRTRDTAGNTSAYVCTDGQRPDTSAPTAPTTRNDGTAADIDWQTSLTQLDANFTAGTDPGGSGVLNHDWCFTTNSGTSCGAGIVGAAGLAQAGTSAQRTGLTLAEGTAYAFCVRARDTAGNVSAYACSDTVTPDVTAPGAPVTISDGGGADVDVQASTTQLDANFAGATDPGGSGVASYDWCFTTAPGSGCSAGVVGGTASGQVGTTASRTGLSLTIGTTYSFCVRSRDVAGTASTWACSDGVTVAAAAPDQLYTSDTNAQVGNTNLTNAGPTPHLSWRNATATAVDAQRTQVRSDTLSGVAGLWHFDTAGPVTQDSSGNGRSATLLASPSSPASRNATFAESLGLDGVSQYAFVPADPAFDLTSNYTVDLWMRTSSSANQFLIEKGTAGNNSRTFAIDLVGGGIVEASVSAGGSTHYAGGSTMLADGSWHHVAMTISATNMLRLYVDGALDDGPVAVGGPSAGAGERIGIGSWGPAPGGYFAGDLDDVRVTARALTAAEIAGYVKTNHPHADVVWDSDTSATGVALGASCASGGRCADVVYGATGAPGALQLGGARYYARQQVRAGAGAWSGWSTDDWFETGADSAPAAPAALAQFHADGTTPIASGGFTSDGSVTDVVLRFDVADPDPGQTLTPWVEIVPAGTPFSETCGAAVAGATFSGPAVAAPTGGSAVSAAVAITGLVADNYAWRACAVDQDGAVGAWTVRGGSPDLRIDLTATPPGTVTDGSGADIDFTPSLTTVAGSWSPASDTGGSGVASYDWCVSTTTSCASPVTGATVTAAVTSFSQGSLALTSGQTYFTCVRTVDAVGNRSAYACSDGETVMTVQSTSPAAIPQGAQNVTLQITGTGFQAGTPTVIVSGTGITSTSTPVRMSPTSISVDIDVAGTATVSTRNVTVTNPDGSSALGTAVLDIVSPTLTLATSTLGYEDASRTFGGSVDFGTLAPGQSREIGPAGSGQTLAGPAVQLDVTADVEAEVNASAVGFTGSGTLAVTALGMRDFGDPGSYGSLDPTPRAVASNVPIGSTSLAWDLRLDIPMATASGGYSTTVSYTVLPQL